tara:strand:- start:355 stop:1455 length:1101 start_codon:yes stop_codon:yes gene_type:complete
MIFGLPLLGGAALLGTAAFGIAKLAGASNKKAIMAGLGVFGGSAALGALTAPAVSAKTSTLGKLAGAGDLAAASTSAELSAAGLSGAPSFMGPQTSVAALQGQGLSQAAALSKAGQAFTGFDAAGNVVGLDSTALKSVSRPDLVTAPTSGNVGANLARIPGAIGSFVEENPGTTLGGVAALGSLAMSPKTSQIYDDSTAPVPFNEQEYTDAYNRQRAAMQRLSERAPAPTRTADALTPANVYERTEEMFAAKQGGLATLKLKEGGVNYLPSKSDHDEKDANNYVRAIGYVEDGSGNGDKDEDTMLAQLADGEFVSRADAILGAGIMSGANPDDFKDMRRKGAQFFYKQQDSLKRVYDLVSDGNKAS